MRAVGFCCALLASSLSQAATPIVGWYSEIFGGYAYLPSSVNTVFDNLSLNHDYYRGGFDVGGSLGFKSSPLRYEGQVTYLKANVNSFRANDVLQTGMTGYQEGVFGLANAYYDFSSFCSPLLQPYLGVGIGYGWVQVALNSNGPNNPLQFSASDSVFAYQGTAGITYNFSETYALTLNYRYLATTNASQLGNLFQAHLANASVVYRFDGNAYK